MRLDSDEPILPRPLTDRERELARWLLEHGELEAQPFLAQLKRSSGATWRCPCGCASFNFQVEGLLSAAPGVHVLADFVFGSGSDLKGIFIYESGGTLSGVEVVGYGGEAPAALPNTSELRPIGNPTTT